MRQNQQSRNKRRNGRSNKRKYYKRRNRRTGPKIRATGQSTFGTLVTKGVRKLVSILPGNAILSPIADVILKSIGLSGSDLSTATSVTEDTVDVVGIITMFTFGLKNIFGGSPIPIKHYASSQTQYLTQYRGLRARSITISYTPSSNLNFRDGTIVLGFEPFTEATEVGNWSNISATRWPDDKSLSSMTASAFGPANRPLRITFTPTAKDGFSYAAQGFSDVYGVVVLRYLNYNRDLYTSITASEFNPEITLSGVIEVLNPTPLTSSLGSGKVVSDSVTDLLANSVIQIIDKNGVGKTIDGSITSKIAVDQSNGNLKVTGTFLSPPTPPEEDFVCLMSP